MFQFLKTVNTETERCLIGKFVGDSFLKKKEYAIIVKPEIVSTEVFTVFFQNL